MSGKRERAYYLEVRIYPDKDERRRWALYSRHRSVRAAKRALTEAVNAHPGVLVELVDRRDEPT